jgi:hypothetical protein
LAQPEELALDEARLSRSTLLSLWISARERANYLIALSVGTAALFLSQIDDLPPRCDSFWIISAGLTTAASIAAGGAALWPTRVDAILDPIHLAENEFDVLEVLVDIHDGNQSLARVLARTSHITMAGSMLYLASIGLWVMTITSRG